MTMTFGAAVQALKSGKRVARAGWNGKNMWLALVRPLPSPDACSHPRENFFGVSLAQREPKEPTTSDPIGSTHDHLYAEPTQVGGGLRALPWIGMKTADDAFVPWLASQTDILAEDWSEV